MADTDIPTHVEAVLLGILAELGDVARFAELFYLTREDGILEAARAIAAMPEERRKEILTLVGAEDPAFAGRKLVMLQ